MMTQERGAFLTVGEAAVIAGVSDVTIRRAIAKRELRYRAERGATKLLRISDVEEWAKRRKEIRQIDDDSGEPA